MYCPKCREEVPEGTKFCPECGAKIYQAASTAPKSVQSKANNARAVPKPSAKKAEKKKKSLTQKPWFIAILILVIIAAAKFGKNSSSSATSSNDRTVTPVNTESKVEVRATTGANTPAITTAAATPSEATTTEKAQEPESTAPVDTTLDAGTIRPDVKEAIDSYEAFIDSYCEFLESYDANDTTMFTEYISLVQKEREMTEKFDAMDDGSLTDAENEYYTKVSLRCSQKLLECAAKIS